MIKNSLFMFVLKSVSPFLKNNFVDKCILVWHDFLFVCFSFRTWNMSLFSLQSKYAVISLRVLLHKMCYSFLGISQYCTFHSLTIILCSEIFSCHVYLDSYLLGSRWSAVSFSDTNPDLGIAT